MVSLGGIRVEHTPCLGIRAPWSLAHPQCKALCPWLVNSPPPYIHFFKLSCFHVQQTGGGDVPAGGVPAKRDCVESWQRCVCVHPRTFTSFQSCTCKGMCACIVFASAVAAHTPGSLFQSCSLTDAAHAPRNSSMSSPALSCTLRPALLLPVQLLQHSTTLNLAAFGSNECLACRCGAATLQQLGSARSARTWFAALGYRRAPAPALLQAWCTTLTPGQRQWWSTRSTLR